MTVIFAVFKTKPTPRRNARCAHSMISLHYFFKYNPITSIIMPARVKPSNGDALYGNDAKAKNRISIQHSTTYCFIMAIGIAPTRQSVMLARMNCSGETYLTCRQSPRVLVQKKESLQHRRSMSMNMLHPIQCNQSQGLCQSWRFAMVPFLTPPM